MIKTAALASALALCLSTASFAQMSGSSAQPNTPGMNNPASSGKAGSPMTTDTTKSSTSGTTGSSMSNPNKMNEKTPGGETGPSGQTAKPK